MKGIKEKDPGLGWFTAKRLQQISPVSNDELVSMAKQAAWCIHGGIGGDYDVTILRLIAQIVRDRRASRRKNWRHP